MAGHSKWANIKHRKAAVDARRGKVFTKASKEIIVAARLGGGDPDANTRLRMAIQNARAVSMSNDTIKRAIQRGTGEIEGATYDELTFEGYGPGGVAVIIESTTDNRKRTVADVRAAFAKCDGNLGESNSVAWNFDRRGRCELAMHLDDNAQVELALELGADDVFGQAEGTVLLCNPDELGRVVSVAIERKLDVQSSGFTWEPRTLVQLSDEHLVKKLLKLLDLLEDHEDIQHVYNNADISDELVDALG
jgi:YebC/PmpR family DNA-binding regulatory protein